MPRYQELAESQNGRRAARIFNDCKAGPRAAVPPPVHVWLKSPGLADNAHKLGGACPLRHAVHAAPDRNRDPDDRALLDRAVRMGGACPARARSRLPQEVIDAIAERRTPSFSDPDEQLVHDFCRDYYDDHRVDDATYERVVARFGDKGIVDLAGLIGYYSFVSVTLNVFEVRPHPAPSCWRTEPCRCSAAKRAQKRRGSRARRAPASPAVRYARHRIRPAHRRSRSRRRPVPA